MMKSSIASAPSLNATSDPNCPKIPNRRDPAIAAQSRWSGRWGPAWAWPRVDRCARPSSRCVSASLDVYAPSCQRPGSPGRPQCGRRAGRASGHLCRNCSEHKTTINHTSPTDNPDNKRHGKSLWTSDCASKRAFSEVLFRFVFTTTNTTTTSTTTTTSISSSNTSISK